MRVMFIDDSEQRHPPRRGLGHLLAVGGLVVPEQQIHPLGVALATIRRDIGVPDAEELKWKPPKRSFLAGAGGEIVQRLRAEMLTAALDHNSRSIVVILDYSAAYSSRTKAEAGREILKWLFERTQSSARSMWGLARLSCPSSQPQATTFRISKWPTSL